MARTVAPATLRETINQNQFYSLTDAVLLRQIHDAFEPELERLKGAYSMREPGSPTICSSGSQWNAKQTPSELLYGRNHDEVNRTLVGVLALRWIINNDYDTFVGCQPAPVRLLRESFDWLRNLFEKGVTTPDDLFALVTAMIINDLGKDPNLEEDYLTQTGESVQGMNHDMVLFEAAKAGDKIALNAFDYTGKILGMGLANAVAVTSPEAIILFGGLSLAGDYIVKPTKKYMEEYMLNIYKNKVKVILSALNDKNAAILGASALVWKEAG